MSWPTWPARRPSWPGPAPRPRGAPSTIALPALQRRAPHHFAQLPTESYAEAKAWLEARAEEIPSDGETRWDQRCCDAFSELIRSSVPGSTGRATTASPYVVVAHVPLAALVGDSGETSVLAGELEYGGLIDGETVQRIACDATVVIGVDDDVGHTMYEGRARRFPTQAQRREVMRRDRHCRFPGFTDVTFTMSTTFLRGNPGAAPTSTIWPWPACTTIIRSTATRGGPCRATPTGSHLRRPERPVMTSRLAAVDQGDDRDPGRVAGMRGFFPPSRTSRPDQEARPRSDGEGGDRLIDARVEVALADALRQAAALQHVVRVLAGPGHSEGDVRRSQSSSTWLSARDPVKSTSDIPSASRTSIRVPGVRAGRR